jgi:hypothetical protein
MKLFLLALLCLFAAGAELPVDSAWKEFSSAEGRFAALMPGEPQTGVIHTATRRGLLHTYSVTSGNWGEGERSSFSVNWTDYPPGSPAPTATQETFDKIRNALVNVEGGKLLDESSEAFAGRAAHAFTYKAGDGDVSKVVVFFDGARFYQLTAETRAGVSGTEARERFVNSFRLLGGAAR